MNYSVRCLRDLIPLSEGNISDNRVVQFSVFNPVGPPCITWKCILTKYCSPPHKVCFLVKLSHASTFWKGLENRTNFRRKIDISRASRKKRESSSNQNNLRRLLSKRTGHFFGRSSFSNSLNLYSKKCMYLKLWRSSKSGRRTKLSAHRTRFRARTSARTWRRAPTTRPTSGTASTSASSSRPATTRKSASSAKPCLFRRGPGTPSQRNRVMFFSSLQCKS